MTLNFSQEKSGDARFRPLCYVLPFYEKLFKMLTRRFPFGTSALCSLRKNFRAFRRGVRRARRGGRGRRRRRKGIRRVAGIAALRIVFRIGGSALPGGPFIGLASFRKENRLLQPKAPDAYDRKPRGKPDDALYETLSPPRRFCSAPPRFGRNGIPVRFLDVFFVYSAERGNIFLVADATMPSRMSFSLSFFRVR